ncbi:hypothetical protein [Bradyrhizobium sp. CCBAU 53380]|uniref:hypothetical protein n=1 Tax=Bradyrhizobium sp. CCBAU 53380 TaxID=1325117 RepID=UPI002302340C|nr:hypothetical protein [Bradyrhizobium sp. CCBAU 53380]
MVTRIITLIVIAPLIVSFVARGYGWQLVLQNGPKGMLNWILMTLHVVDAPISVLYTEVAVVIGSQPRRCSPAARRAMVEGVPPRDAAAEHARFHRGLPWSFDSPPAPSSFRRSWAAPRRSCSAI